MTARIELDDVALAYRDTGGSGPAVAFIHGLGGRAEAWQAQLRSCAAAGLRALAHDQRGAGESGVPPGPYSVRLCASDAIALLDALAVERVALVGHSVGTMVAEQAALRLGERCTALVLIGGALAWPPEARPAFERRAELARAGRLDEIAAAVTATGLSERCRRERPELADRLRSMIAANDPSGYAESALATAGGRLLKPGRVAAPTLALAGERDSVTPPAAADAIAAAMRDGRSAIVPGAAHWCQIEAPAAVDRALHGFLSKFAT